MREKKEEEDTKRGWFFIIFLLSLLFEERDALSLSLSSSSSSSRYHRRQVVVFCWSLQSWSLVFFPFLSRTYTICGAALGEEEVLSREYTKAKEESG